MQADAGLVEDVEHAGKSAADLRGEADALGLAARERAAGAVEIEVVEADIVEETQPLVDFLQDGAGDLLLLLGEVLVEAEEPRLRVRHAHARGCGDVGRAVGARDLHRERLFVEALAMAGLARLRGLELGQLLAHPRAVGLEQAAVEVADHPLERLFDRVGLAPVLEGKRHRIAARAVQDDIALVGRQLVPRRFEAEIIGRR